jgi:hypothetical protein
MSYFHTRMRTIIGAELFHGPVRDGKGWFQFAMVIRHNLLTKTRPIQKLIDCISMVKIIGSSRTGN